MSYTPKWTSEARVEALLQIDITSATDPNSTELLDWIEEVETSMLADNLGTQTTPSLTEFDVPPSHALAKETIGWFHAGLPESTQGRIVVPPYVPIVSVNSGTVSRNKASLNQAPDWELLKAKDNFPSDSDTDFMILYEVDKKTGKRLGFAFYFYNNIPEAGYRRLRGTWVYGHNVDSEILREYATLKVAEKVILARLFSAQPMNLASYTGGDMNTYVNTQFEVQLEWIRQRIGEIEKRHFPRDIPIAVLQDV